MIGYALSSKGDVRPRLEYAFDLYDTNCTGKLDWSDVRAVVTGMYDLLGASTKHENFEALVDRTVNCIGPDRVPKGKYFCLSHFSH
jgi:Ca2+-binding EF-hand superfamily protein